MGELSMLEVIIGIFTVSAIIASSSAYFFRMNVNAIKEQSTQNTTKLLDDVKQFNESLGNSMNSRFDNMNSRMDRQQDLITTNLRDVTRHVEKIKDDVHNQEKSIMLLRIDIADKFATKDELSKLEKQVEKIQTINSN